MANDCYSDKALVLECLETPWGACLYRIVHQVFREYDFGLDRKNSWIASNSINLRSMAGPAIGDINNLYLRGGDALCDDHILYSSKGRVEKKEAAVREYNIAMQSRLPIRRDVALKEWKTVVIA